MLVVCVGMPRSASTWQYQVATELLRRNGAGAGVGFQPSSALERGDNGCLQVVKWHEPDDGYAAALAAGAAVALYSYRDLRDVAFSAAHHLGIPFESLLAGGFIQRTIASDAFWRSQPNVLVQEYSEITADPVSAVAAIASHLSLPLAPDAAAEIAHSCSVDANRVRIAALRDDLVARGVDLADPGNAAACQDRDTLLHWNHIRDESLPWRQLATPAQRAALVKGCAEWLVERGYEVDDSWRWPTFSVVIPSLNRARYIAVTIDSVLSQDYQNAEVVVADGGSTDGTLDILEGYGDRIRWFSEPDLGPFDAINKGWARTTGEIIAWLNADDSYTPGAVSAAIRAFDDHPEVDVVHGACATLTTTGEIDWVWGNQPWDYIANVVNCACTIDQPAAFMRRAAVERVGGLHPIAVLDFDLWIRMSAAGATFLAIDQHLANAVDHPDRITNRPEVMVPAVVEAIRRAVNDPAAPISIRKSSRRAMSAAYAHGFYFVGRRRWGWVARCAIGAVRADPNNAHGVLTSLLNALEWERGSPLPVRLATKAGRRAWASPAVILQAAQLGAFAMLLARSRGRRGRPPVNGSRKP